ncbi:DUF1573 domain-containing protein [Candidatus Omnitrophota bacterium]
MRFLRIAGFVFIFFLACLEASGEYGPRIIPVDAPWYFGRIKKGEVKEKTFKVKNVGDENLILDKVHACCGYNVSDVSVWELAPGSESEIMVTSDTSRKDEGRDSNVITILSNDLDNGTLEVPVTSNIIE